MRGRGRVGGSEDRRRRLGGRGLGQGLQAPIPLCILWRQHSWLLTMTVVTCPQCFWPGWGPGSPGSSTLQPHACLVPSGGAQQGGRGSGVAKDSPVLCSSADGP